MVLIFGEVSPKSMAKEAPEQFAMFSAPIIGALMVILTPVNWFFAGLKRLLSRIMRGGDKEGITEEELVTMVDQAESEGGLDQHESKLIRAAIEFHDLEVEEILTPPGGHGGGGGYRYHGADRPRLRRERLLPPARLP